jgi:outer membrane biosynthesis protein TonB
VATTLQQLGNGVEIVYRPDGTWIVSQAGDVSSGTVWEWVTEAKIAGLDADAIEISGSANLGTTATATAGGKSAASRLGYGDHRKRPGQYISVAFEDLIDNIQKPKKVETKPDKPKVTKKKKAPARPKPVPIEVLREHKETIEQYVEENEAALRVVNKKIIQIQKDATEKEIATSQAELENAMADQEVIERELEALAFYLLQLEDEEILLLLAA